MTQKTQKLALGLLLFGCGERQQAPTKDESQKDTRKSCMAEKKPVKSNENQSENGEEGEKSKEISESESDNVNKVPSVKNKKDSKNPNYLKAPLPTINEELGKESGGSSIIKTTNFLDSLKTKWRDLYQILQELEWINMAPKSSKRDEVKSAAAANSNKRENISKKFAKSNSNDTSLVDYSPYDNLSEKSIKYLLNFLENIKTSKDNKFVKFNRALGALVGNCVGDFVGAPFEFFPVRDSPVDSLKYDPKGDLYEMDQYKNTKKETKSPDFKITETGHWTDDFSMARCLADSLIKAFGEPGDYDGRDLRARFWCWWNHGYNNAFRHVARNGSKISVGLGTNISYSLNDICKAKNLEEINPKYYVKDGKDAGNGSIMRLSPVVLRFSHDLEKCLQIAAEQSYATHTGQIAADSARFMAFIIWHAINRTNAIESPKEFLDRVVADFLKQIEEKKIENVCPEIIQLAKCEEGKEKKELNWKWKDPKTYYSEVMKNRGSTYNGYGNSATYFGSYAADGLAMALNSFYNTNSFEEALVKCVNHCGDSDTTGAITSQIAGSFYGYNTIPQKYIDAKNKHDKIPGKTDCHGIEIQGITLLLMSECA